MMPTPLFCKTTDTTDRIHLLYKKRQNKLNNKAIGTNLIDADLKAIETSSYLV